jgi:hypothetical protein
MRDYVRALMPNSTGTAGKPRIPAFGSEVAIRKSLFDRKEPLPNATSTTPFHGLINRRPN